MINVNDFIIIYIANQPKISTSVMQQDIDHLTVLLEWMAEKGVTYNLTTEPETIAENITTSNIILIKITVSYNTSYNVSVEATLCGRMNVSTVEIYYGKFYK